MSTTTPEDRARAFLSAVEELPPYEGLAMRGRTADAEFVRPGQSTVATGIIAASRKASVALAGASNGLYAVWSRTGRSITPFSAHREEDEVVFLPGSAFYLVGSRLLEGVDVHLVVEIELTPGFQLPADLPDRLAAAARSALEADVHDVPSRPDKFAGDIG